MRAAMALNRSAGLIGVTMLILSPNVLVDRLANGGRLRHGHKDIFRDIFIDGGRVLGIYVGYNHGSGVWVETDGVDVGAIHSPGLYRHFP